MNCATFSYHFSQTGNSLNGVKGIFIKNGIYHIYYAVNSVSQPEKTRWEHIFTANFCKYKKICDSRLPNGEKSIAEIFGGAIYACGGTVGFYYTEKRTFGNKEKYRTLRAKSKNGSEIFCKNTLLSSKNYPKEVQAKVTVSNVLLCHGKYVMCLNARENTGKDIVLFYVSENGDKWNLHAKASAEFDIKNALYVNGYLLFTDGTRVCYSQMLSLPTEFKIILSKKTPLDYGTQFFGANCFFDGVRYILAGVIKTDSGNVLSTVRQINFTGRGITQKPLQELKKLRKKSVTQTLSEGGVMLAESTAYEVYLTPSGDFSATVGGVNIVSDKKELHIKCGKIVGKMPYYGKSVRVFCDNGVTEIFTCGKCFSLFFAKCDNKIKITLGKCQAKLWNMKNIDVICD